MLIPLGILSSAGSLGFESDYELISTSLITTNTTSVVFDTSSLGSTYKHLQLRYTLRTDRVLNSDSLSIRLNADTGSNYAWHRLQGDGSSVASSGLASQTTMRTAIVAGGTSAANSFSGGVTDILDPFSTSKNTTIRSLSGMTDINFVVLWSGLYINTSSTTSITLLNDAGPNFVAGSRFSLYGIRG
jgi:hypothetical protein